VGETHESNFVPKPDGSDIRGIPKPASKIGIPRLNAYKIESRTPYLALEKTTKQPQAKEVKLEGPSTMLLPDVPEREIGPKAISTLVLVIYNHHNHSS
jgi:hypothetical protein